MKNQSNLLQTWRTGLAAAALILAAAVPARAQTYFRVTSSAGNTSASVLTLDHPSLNGKSKSKPLITQFWDGIYNPHQVGVQYNPVSGRWQIVNEDGVNIPAGAKFNVLIAKGTKTVLASATNSYSDVTFFPTAKGNPAARLLFTHVTNPVLTLPATRSARNYGLYYIPAGPSYGGQWSIYSEDGENVEALGFHVADVTKLKNGSNPASFVATASGSNVFLNEAIIDNALTTGNPNDFVFVQHVWINGASTYLDEAIGVYYSGNKWRVFLQDAADTMPNNVAFVVAVFPGTGV
jgi:hypothetical protein